MRLTVLGGDGGWPRPGGGCNGYLVESGHYTLVVDPLGRGESAVRLKSRGQHRRPQR
jgi:hypothetical protein